MDTLKQVVEAFIRLVKSEINLNAVLIAADDVFEVTDVPSFIVQGPKLKENQSRRTLARIISKDTQNLTYEECNYPRLYHLDFEIIVTCGHEEDLILYQEKTARFFMLRPSFAIGTLGYLNLREFVPLGGLNRVNLSNMRQSSGIIRIEDCPIYDGVIKTGHLIKNRKFEYKDGVDENRIYAP